MPIPDTFTEEINQNGKTLCFDMVKVEGGKFMMGSEERDREQPVHEVTAPDFYMAQCLVTQELYSFVMGENPSYFRGKQRPVERVSWDDAQAFIRKLNGLPQTKLTYRLPTEAEWEYAARSGIHWEKGFEYAGSDTIDEVAWYGENSRFETKGVGLKKPNQLGIFDMSGNVFEWCEDDWHNNYNNAPKDGSAWIDEPDRSALRILRGGYWYDDADISRVAYRNRNFPGNRSGSFGFRLAVFCLV
jgi:formylglycine-generating enzyme required for sulfatase activity